MPEQNREHGRKSSGHQHGGMTMGKRNKRHRAAKKRAKNIGQVARMDRATTALTPAIAKESTPAATAASESPPEPTVEPKSGTRSSRMGRGEVALLAFAMAGLVASITVVRACDRDADPAKDDAAAPDSCSEDAAVCVALA